MAEKKDLASKDIDDLSETEAAELAYSRSTVSLDDYNPAELAPEDKVVEWDKRSFKNSEEAAEETDGAASTATASFAEKDTDAEQPTRASRKGDPKPVPSLDSK